MIAISIITNTILFLKTPLYIAVCDGSLPVVKCLFGECSSVIPDASVDDKGTTMLHVATEHGCLGIIKSLISECKLSANKLIKAHSHQTILRAALENGCS